MTGSATGGVRVVLRIEGVCILLVSLLAYGEFSGSWWIFALFFLAPDLSFLGYVAGPRAGAVIYNIAHSLAGALLLLGAGFLLNVPMAVSAGIIWTAHIGFDRAAGYGLKYATGFGFTHLGRIGRVKADVS